MNAGYSTQKQIYNSSDPPKSQGNEVLFRVRATHILELFPDELIVEEKTISVVRREFLSTYIETLPLEDVKGLSLTQAGPYATISINGKNGETAIHNLPSGRAQKAKEVIDSLLSQDRSELRAHEKIVSQYT